MKKITLFSMVFLVGLCVMAQTPQAVNYQAVARDADGDPVTEQNITAKVSILSGSVSGEIVYSELHSATTNSIGLFTLTIGSPDQVLSGSFEDIDWGNNDYFLKVEMDAAGGTDFQLLGTSQLLSVPYALYSENTAHPEDADADPGNELQTLSQNGSEVMLSQSGGTVIAGIKSYTQSEIDMLTTYNGLTVHNATTNCINYFFMNKWFEMCGSCTPMPSQADAGEDQGFYDGTNETTLQANTPEAGTGFWSILSGEGGSFVNVNDPTTVFTGQLEETYILQWAIGTACDTTYDEVSIGFYTWQCGLPFTDIRDEKIYETVDINQQCWMADNLAYLPGVSPSSSGSNTSAYYYVYGYQDTVVAEAKETDNYQNYGVLYNWPASVTSCPDGWHLPDNNEWTTMVNYLGGTNYAGGKMKSTRTEPDPHPRWDSPNTGATNSSGFTGFPGGFRLTDGTFSNLGSDALWWGSTESSATKAWDWCTNKYSDDVTHYNIYKEHALSVRCVKDQEN